MSAKHTLEPWKTDASNGFPCDVENIDGDLIARCPSDCADDIDGAINARRIVACVNACAGIPPGRIEAGATDILAYSMELKTQRDELLAALEGMVSVARLTIGWSCTPANADGPLVVAERLIASVKGGAA